MNVSINPVESGDSLHYGSRKKSPNEKTHDQIAAEFQAKAAALLSKAEDHDSDDAPGESYNTPSRRSPQRRPGSGSNISSVASKLKALYDSYEVDDQRRRQRLGDTVMEFSQKLSNKKKKKNEPSIGVLDHRWSRVAEMVDEERNRVERQTRVLGAMEKRWDVKLHKERKKRLDQGVQHSLQIQAVKNETIALIQQERREEIDLLRQQLADENLRRKENESIQQQQQTQIEKLKETVAQLTDSMLMTKAVLAKEQQLRKQTEEDHLTLLKEYHAANTAAIDVERRHREKMELSMLRVLEGVCGKVEDGLGAPESEPLRIEHVRRVNEDY